MMTKLTDLEICKRIAEIEGKEIHSENNFSVNVIESCFNLGCPAATQYSPLIDDALCFQLMVKYDIRVESFEPTLKDGSDGYEYHCYKQGALNYASNTLSISKSPNKAICLAIIEAHKND